MGKNGSRRAIVNSHGREVGRLDETPAEPGKQLKLTVDLDLQIAAEQALEGRTARSWPWIRTPAKSWRW
jgi:penicillin-binding protein 2